MKKHLVETARFNLIQTKAQAFNTDTILLANFVKIPKRTKNILDIGTGSGVLALDLAHKTKANIYAVEVQENRYRQAQDNVRLNGLSSRIKIINEDINNFDNNILYDLIISNPPFFKVNADDQLSDNEEEMIARHEIKLNLEGLIKNTSRLLKYRGHFYMIHRPDRLDEIIAYCKQYNLAVKMVRFIHPYQDKLANHVLIKAIKNSNQGMLVDAPLILYKDKLELTEEMKTIIGGF